MMVSIKIRVKFFMKQKAKSQLAVSYIIVIVEIAWFQEDLMLYDRLPTPA